MTLTPGLWSQPHSAFQAFQTCQPCPSSTHKGSPCWLSLSSQHTFACTGQPPAPYPCDVFFWESSSVPLPRLGALGERVCLFLRLPFVLIVLTPDLVPSLSFLQTSTDIPKTETPAPTLPPTPAPLVITTTVAIGSNVTVLEVVGSGRGWKGRSWGSGGGRQ